MSTQNKPSSATRQNLSEIKKSILAALAYFDLFNYPLTGIELYLFLSKKYENEQFDGALRCLLACGTVYQFDRFYTLKNDPYLVARRNQGNEQAKELIKIAGRIGDMLIRFPYVRGIAVSGSLSKNFADEFSDIDLFIITEKNRLWIARTVMHCFKKLTFLVNKQHYFCMNYYVDEQQLEIEEKNLYTAIEIGTLIPLQGDLVFERFYAANSWTRSFLPNKNVRIASAKPVKRTVFKRIFECIFNVPFGNTIDNMLMKITTERWQKKSPLKKLNSHGQLFGIVTGKHYSKPDPKNFQRNLLANYENKVSGLLNDHKNSLVN